MVKCGHSLCTDAFSSCKFCTGGSNACNSWPMRSHIFPGGFKSRLKAGNGKVVKHWFEGRLECAETMFWRYPPCILALRRMRDCQNEVKQPVTGHCKCTGCPSDCLVRWPGSECNHVRGIPTSWLSVPRTERLAGYSWVYTLCSCGSTPISRPSMIWRRNLLTPNWWMRRHDLRFKFHLVNNHCRRSLWWRFVRTGLLMTFLKQVRFLKVLMEKRRLSSGSFWRWELVAKGKGMKSYYANQRPVFALWRRCRSPQTFSILPCGSEPMGW